MPERIACRQVPENSRTFPPFEKGGSGGISLHHYPINLIHHRFRFYHYFPAVEPIVKSPRLPLQKGEIFGVFFGLSLNPPDPLYKRGRVFGVRRRGRCSGFGKEGDIPRLFSDRMPERIACRQVSENSRTFPPFEKGGSGGISLHHYPINLLHHRFRFYHYFPAVEPIVKSPRPPLVKGEIFEVLQKGEIFGVFFGLSVNPPGPLYKRGRVFGVWQRGRCSGFGKEGDIPRLFSDRMPERIACRQVSENSRTFPPFEKGGSGGISLHHYPINLLHHRFRFYHYFPAVEPIVKSPRPPLVKGEIFEVLQKGEIFGVFFGLSLNPRLPPYSRLQIPHPASQGSE
jgi:hypothetical protein